MTNSVRLLFLASVRSVIYSNRARTLARRLRQRFVRFLRVVTLRWLPLHSNLCSLWGQSFFRRFEFPQAFSASEQVINSNSYERSEWSYCLSLVNEAFTAFVFSPLFLRGDIGVLKIF